jgi:bis(5'-nucleosidyl)-tetraphosphatase
METSCGFVLVNYDSILLLQYPQGHWSFPKGHIEDDDDDQHSTALRELIEETGIKEIIIDKNWNFRTDYTFKRKGKEIPKQVFWFLAETDELEVKLSHEHTNYLWLNFEDCEKQLTFRQEKILLQSARNYREKIKK